LSFGASDQTVVAKSAIAEYVSGRPDRLRAAIERVRTEDAELLDRLSR
jgi:hypothetical protein